MAVSDFSEFSDDYEESLGGSHKYFLKVKADVLAGIIARHCGSQPEKARCLDLGCGTGEIEEHLKDLDIVGMDLTRGMLVQTSAKATEGDFVQASACVLPFRNGTFDVIFSMSMIHHIPDGEEKDNVFREACRVLKKGGLLITFEHNPVNPITRYKVSTCPMDRGTALVMPSELRRRYEKNGIRFLGTKYIVFFPPVLDALRPIESAIYFIPLGGQYYVIGKSN